MQRVSCAAFAFFGLLLSPALLPAAPARADDYLYASRHGDFLVEGTVQSLNRTTDRLTLIGANDRRYNVDIYAADILLRGSRRLGETDDLARGMRVEITGTLVGGSLVEAARVRVLPEFRGAGDYVPDDAPRDTAPVPDAPPPPAYVPPVYVPAAPPPGPVYVPHEPPPAPAQPQLNLDLLLRDVDAARGQATALGDDDKRYTLDLQNTDIILRGTERAGLVADLARGMRVRVIGAFLPSGAVEADRVRVLPPPEAPIVPPAAAPAAPPAVEDMSAYTGILIDGRGLPRISRSPAPAVYGPRPDEALLYPDRSHVPTPDEVQEESIVRYYHSEADAESGIAGPRPLILTALAVLASDDALQLSALDAARFQALDKRLHFTRTWKVGFLIPGNQ